MDLGEDKINRGVRLGARNQDFSISVSAALSRPYGSLERVQKLSEGYDIEYPSFIACTTLSAVMCYNGVMKQNLKLSSHEREALDSLQKAYLESAVEAICQFALLNRQPVTFDMVYELTQMKKAQIIRLLENDTDFHIDLRCLIQSTNEKLKSL